MKTKIFCDTADYNIIKKYSKYKIVEGFTTSPSLMRKVGAKNYKYHSLDTVKKFLVDSKKSGFKI